MTQVEELVTMYYKLVKLRPLPGFKKRSMEAVTNLIDHGIQAAKIKSTIEYYIDHFEDYSEKPYISLSTVFSVTDIQSLLNSNSINKDNLIDSARFYYHKRLRLSPKAPKMFMDKNGNHTTIVEPFFLEMIKTFTSEYLLEYFYSVHEVNKISRKPKRDLAAIKYIIGIYKDCTIEANWLDLILYMIDVSRQVIVFKGTRPLTNVLHIQDYELQALDILEDKMNYERINGVDKIVPRKTVDSGDGWTK